MQTRLIRYFLALVKERHFANAAEQCGVTQPTLSAGIHALEQQLGHRLIVRDRRFTGLTPAGEALLPWARQLIAAQEGVKAAVAFASGPPSGEFRLGYIPAALPFTGRLAHALLQSRPALSLNVRSLSSREISRALANYEIDGGLTYLDHEPLPNVLSVPLYAEQYRILVHRDTPEAERGSLSLEEVVRLPLCLLHQGMQNRRILDSRFAERGLELLPRVTADSYVSLLSMVQSGSLATIVPDSYSAMLPDMPWVTVLGFKEDLASRQIGLVVLDRTPLTVLAETAIETARSLVR
ncbi:MAG: LysR family transcriptional regulator [Sphingomonadaceae bacterium]|nr:LysR family transcriptional regulator [Sphingomonadaceae bacterium]